MSAAPPPPGSETSKPLQLNDLQAQVFAAMVLGEAWLAVRAGWGSGKTATIVFLILYRAEAFPGETILLVTDTGSRYERVLGPELAKWLRPLGWYYVAGRNITGRWIDPVTRTMVVVVPYQRAANRDSTHNPLEGINAGSALIDECQVLPPEVADKAFGRVRAGRQPFLGLFGLPKADAWWIRYVQERGGRTLFAASHVNAANLPGDWLAQVEKLPPAVREAMVYNRPQPPEGQVYREWSAEPWPAGNLTPPGWRYHPSMEVVIAADWGVVKPWIGFFAFDPALNADVLVAELSPRDVSVPQLVRLILQLGWPRDYVLRMPRDGRRRFLLDGGSGDKAGRARNDTTLQDTFERLALPPPVGTVPRGTAEDECGIGLDLVSTSKPSRTHIVNGVQRVRSAIMERSILCESGLWSAGLGSGHEELLASLGVRANGNTFARAIMDYRYPEKAKGGGDEPVKSGFEDPMDGLRYHVINLRWNGIAPGVELPTPNAAPTKAATVAGPHRSWQARAAGR